MLEITATADWHETHTGGTVGLLEVSGVDNSQPSPALNACKLETIARLRERYAGFARADFRALPVMADYVSYYKRFKKTYHVLQQVESIVLKGRDLPGISPLVDAAFCMEVESLILTASHDVAKLVAPVIIDISGEGDEMTQMNGKTRVIRTGDMVMRDATRLICSIIYGQDNVSPVTAETTRALYVAYAPAGIDHDVVMAHLDGIERYVRLFCPEMVVEQKQVMVA